ncbi:ferredoxin [Pseudonocardia sp.]|jgi:ferredoxin|uniref:ferredoxin n=1 Tax=Pseudonocardia sp. TaxID=60912 RepID=UPI00261FE504|nr:ferredoxin [Pseudonocardia sp.]MCW2722959.1 ferredoxin [Pseudonocardia sp.]
MSRRAASIPAPRAVAGEDPVELRVDPIMCHAHGLCAEMLPELLQLDEWGYPIIGGGCVPAELRAQARRAASACPTLALRLERRPPQG